MNNKPIETLPEKSTSNKVLFIFGIILPIIPFIVFGTLLFTVAYRLESYIILGVGILGLAISEIILGYLLAKSINGIHRTKAELVRIDSEIHKSLIKNKLLS